MKELFKLLCGFFLIATLAACAGTQSPNAMGKTKNTNDGNTVEYDVPQTQAPISDENQSTDAAKLISPLTY